MNSNFSLKILFWIVTKSSPTLVLTSFNLEKLNPGQEILWRIKRPGARLSGFEFLSDIHKHREGHKRQATLQR